jgi:hypothetical protein
MKTNEKLTDEEATYELMKYLSEVSNKEFYNLNIRLKENKYKQYERIMIFFHLYMTLENNLEETITPSEFQQMKIEYKNLFDFTCDRD